MPDHNLKVTPSREMLSRDLLKKSGVLELEFLTTAEDENISGSGMVERGLEEGRREAVRPFQVVPPLW